MGVVRDPKIFRTLIYRAHRAVIFAIAQLSCEHLPRLAAARGWYSSCSLISCILFELLSPSGEWERSVSGIPYSNSVPRAQTVPLPILHNYATVKRTKV